MRGGDGYQQVVEMDLNNMVRNVTRIALTVAGLVLVVGGGIAAVSPRTAQVMVNRAAGLVEDNTSFTLSHLPAIDAGIWVGREHNLTDSHGQTQVVALLDGRQPQLREEGFIASSRQESREAFRAWAHNAQILGLLLLLAAGLTGRRRVYIRPNRVAATPVTPAPTAPTDPPVGPDPDLVVDPPVEPEKPAEPAQPVPAAVTVATDTVHDGTGGDLDSAPHPEPPAKPETTVVASDPDPTAVAELTISVTRADGSTETVRTSGCKVAEARNITISVMRSIEVELRDCR